MLYRDAFGPLLQLVNQFPVVAIIGSRQVGKTTFVKTFAQTPAKQFVYLDLELPSDLAKLQDPELYFSQHTDKLIILDEIQRVPNIYTILRAVVDKHRKPGRFLLLGSASSKLLKQTSESLAGRIAYFELTPFLIHEILNSEAYKNPEAQLRKLWLRGGYPPSFLASTLNDSDEWRRQYINSYVERDFSQLGIQFPSPKLRRFWQMLAHWNGQLWNASKFASNFGMSAPMMREYLDTFESALLVRVLQPLHVNLAKRLVKSPKIYIRDTGLLHTLLNISDMEVLSGHPSLGASFEGFVIEQILNMARNEADATFYRTHAGAEIDLVLTFKNGDRIVVEVKYSASPPLPRNMPEVMAELNCKYGYIITAGKEVITLTKQIDAVPLHLFIPRLSMHISSSEPKDDRSKD